jgi:hypothetical protein
MTECNHHHVLSLLNFSPPLVTPITIPCLVMIRILTRLNFEVTNSMGTSLPHIESEQLVGFPCVYYH